MGCVIEHPFGQSFFLRATERYHKKCVERLKPSEEIQNAIFNMDLEQFNKEFHIPRFRREDVVYHGRHNR